MPIERIHCKLDKQTAHLLLGMRRDMGLGRLQGDDHDRKKGDWPGLSRLLWPRHVM